MDIKAHVDDMLNSGLQDKLEKDRYPSKEYINTIAS
jgi:hypothetical protein